MNLKQTWAELAADKKLHIAAGLIAGLVGGMFAVSAFGLSGLPVAMCCVLVAGCAGMLKEAWDHFNGGVVDKMDVLYTAAAGLPTSIIFAVLA
jgi:hypothetical protein